MECREVNARTSTQAGLVKQNNHYIHVSRVFKLEGFFQVSRSKIRATIWRSLLLYSFLAGWQERHLKQAR